MKDVKGSVEQLVRVAYEGQLQSVREILTRCGNSVAAVDNLIDNFSQHGAGMIDKITAITKPACKAGCNFCCHIPVSVTALEAIALARHLKATSTAEELAEIRSRIATHVTETAALSWREYVEKRMRCPLLSSDGKCTVHSARPMSCRWTNSFSATQCKAALDRESDGHIDIDLQSLMWGRSVSHGLQDGLKEFQIDEKSYELHPALLRALGTPEIEERWIRGESVFNGCKLTPA